MNSISIYPQTLPERTAELASKLQAQRPVFLSDFYLSGGTGLSLQLGHRASEDLDFFSPHTFDPVALQNKLTELGPLENLELADNTLNVFVQGVKLQFLHYPYKLLEPLVDWNGIAISSVIDIACTKLHTISMRGSKKDFVDLFFILKNFTLSELFEQLATKYANSNFNQAHILKSLVYFDDAEQQPMPRMQQEVSWEEVKGEILRKIKFTAI